MAQLVSSPPAARQRRLPAAIPIAIAVGWLLALVAETFGKATLLNHGTLIEGRAPVFRPPPLWVALPLFLLAWQAMVAAMMLPSTLPMLRLFRAASASVARPAVAFAAFVGGYLSLWGLFGAAAFVQDIGVHRVVNRTPWLGTHPWAVAGSALALAGAFQFSPLKERCLAKCRHPGAYLLRHYRRGTAAAFRLGWGHGLFCLGCCWALMLVMFGAGVANLWWMAPLTALMVYEKLGRQGERVARMAGGIMLGLAAVVLAHLPLFPAGL